VSVSDTITVTPNYTFIRKTFGYNIAAYRPQGSILTYDGLGEVEGPYDMFGGGSGY